MRSVWHLGYRVRLADHEVLTMTDELKTLVLGRAPAMPLRKLQRPEGCRPSSGRLRVR
jgi:type II secretory ATPase GspE/PulE/Tfp pilus assembly ATPase PilB-like protein